MKRFLSCLLFACGLCSSWAQSFNGTAYLFQREVNGGGEFRLFVQAFEGGYVGGSAYIAEDCQNGDVVFVNCDPFVIDGIDFSTISSGNYFSFLIQATGDYEPPVGIHVFLRRNSVSEEAVLPKPIQFDENIWQCIQAYSAQNPTQKKLLNTDGVVSPFVSVQPSSVEIKVAQGDDGSLLTFTQGSISGELTRFSDLTGDTCTILFDNNLVDFVSKNASDSSAILLTPTGFSATAEDRTTGASHSLALDKDKLSLGRKPAVYDYNIDAIIPNYGAATKRRVDSLHATDLDRFADNEGNLILEPDGAEVLLISNTAGSPAIRFVPGDNISLTATGGTDLEISSSIAGTAGGSLSGTYPNPTIAANAVGGAEIANGAVGSSEINQMSATNGQVLKWNGTAWLPGTDNTGGGGGSAPNKNYYTLDAGSVTADQNNWSPTGYNDTTAMILVQPGTGKPILTGIVPKRTGSFSLVLVNNGTDPFFLSNQDAASTAANRFSLPTPYVLVNEGWSATLQYDDVADRWRVAAIERGLNPTPDRVLSFSASTVSNTTTSWPGFANASSGGSLSGTGAGSSMKRGYINTSTSASATGRYVLQSQTGPYLSAVSEFAYGFCTAQPQAASDGTESVLYFVGWSNQPDISTATKVAGFIAAHNGAVWNSYTFLDTDWHAVTFDGSGTMQVLDTNIAPAYTSTVTNANLDRLQVVLSKRGAEYWIDGTYQTTHSTEITMNAALNFIAGVDKTAGTTARVMSLSAIGYEYRE